MGTIRVSLFGAPRVERDGSQLPISRRKVLALLAYLACTAQAHSREALLALLWPEAETSAARANLRRDLSRLKEWLDGTGLEVSRAQVRLEPQAETWLDVAEFRARLDRVQQHAHPPPQLCPDCLLALTEAVSLYQDHFMAGFGLADSPAFDEWQFFEAESLRRLLADALQRLVGWHASQREYEPAIAYARRWLALDTLHEPAQRQLMLLYARSGQPAAALRQYQECERLLADELGVEPEAETTELYEAIRTRQIPADVEQSAALPLESPAWTGQPAAASPVAPPPKARHNLPAQMTPTLGRQAELEHILHSLGDDPGCRLLTLVGPGGSGKTRLAIQAALLLAQAVLPVFSDGVWFVALAALGDAESVLTAVAHALDFSFLGDPSQRRQQLLDHLRSKRLLLVLDNFEHLLDAEIRAWMAELLQAVPDLKVLATSRTRLDILGEQVFSVPGLQLPPPDLLDAGQLDEAQLLAYSAVQLFIQSGKRLQPDFAVTSQNLSGVVRVCRLVEGMPLGIELAAAWLDLLPPDEIAAEIERSLDFLEVEWAGIPERQRSLRAVFNSSWQLLDQQERAALQSMSIFPGSFIIQAVQAVSGVSMKVLRGLMHKSWLKKAPGGRYQIHELLRQYVTERLYSEPAGHQAAAGRYAAYYAAFLEEQARILRGPRQAQAYQAMEDEFENVRLAWELCLDRTRLNAAVERMLPALFRFCEVRLRAFDLFNLIDPALQVLEAGPPSRYDSLLRVVLQVARAGFFRNGYPVRFETYGYFIPSDEAAIRQAWEAAEQAGALGELGFWSIYLAYLYGRLFDRQQGAAQLRSLVAQFRGQARDWDLAFTLYSLGALIEVILYDELDTPALRQETERCLTEALSIFQALGDPRESGNTQRTLGNLYLKTRQYPDALFHWQAARSQLRQAGEWALAAGISWQIGDLYRRQGEFEAAFGEFASMSRTYHERGYPQIEAYALSKESMETVRYGDVDRARALRERALDISHQSHDLFGEAWSSWELGDIYRVSGDYQVARTWYETAWRLYEQVGDQSGHIFYQRGLGDLAQAAGDYPEALRCFQESLAWAQKLGHEWGAAYALSGLGRATLGLGQVEAARRYFFRALRLSHKVDDSGLVMIALCGLADISATAGEAQRAAELAGLVAHHKLTWNETRSQAEALLGRLAAVMPPDLQAHRLETDLAELVQQILADAPEVD
jgi:predicted ATPase/DNA-binding SARP family transcriptional activator